MPVYEYECKGCGHEFEKQQRISDSPAKKCPSCGAMKAKRLISRTSFVLKGSGWYNDLYSSSGGKKEAEGGKEADKGSESGATGSEAKSESKSKGKSGGKSGAKSDGKGASKKGKAAA